jgi:hypothetical protein
MRSPSPKARDGAAFGKVELWKNSPALGAVAAIGIVVRIVVSVEFALRRTAKDDRPFGTTVHAQIITEYISATRPCLQAFRHAENAVGVNVREERLFADRTAVNQLLSGRVI